MHRTGTRDQWREERLALLAREKELTRLTDELARERQALSSGRGPEGVRLRHAGRAQDARRAVRRPLAAARVRLQHPAGGGGCCGSCSSIADGVNGPHAAPRAPRRDFADVSRAPLQEIEAYRARMGWSFRWASSHPSDFNFDFLVSSTEERPLPEYNFRPIPEDQRFVGERPGVSAFALEDGRVFHTYSTYERGVDATGAYTRGSTARPRAATRTATGTAGTTSTRAWPRDRPRRAAPDRGDAPGGSRRRLRAADGAELATAAPQPAPAQSSSRKPILSVTW